MKSKNLFLLFFLCFINLIHLSGGIDFSSRDSSIQVLPGSSFHNHAGNLVVDGTLIRDTGGTILGNTITFSNGMFESEYFEAMMTAFLDPTPGGDLSLVSGRIDARPGTLLRDINIAGNSNWIEGQPLFQGIVSLDETAPSTLNIAVQNTLSTTINLNGFGTLILHDNLALSDNAEIKGPGIVKLNERRLSLGGFYDAPWNTNILWDNATDIVLNGNTTLSTSWNFLGINRINGNGHILDLSPEGRLVLQPGAILYLTDLYLRGLGDINKKGKIVFMDDSARVYSSNTDFELVRDVTTTLGGIYVNGPTTFILKDNDWTFSYMATLTVDGITLWVDTLDRTNYLTMGQLSAPLPLYAEPENLGIDFAVGNLEFINSGTVKIVSDKSEILPASGELLVSGSITEDITLEHSRFIHPDEQIVVAGNITIDGAGAVLYFATHERPVGPQFIILEGHTLILKNVNLAGLTSNTFEFQKDSRLIIGENVSWELHEDINLTGENIFLQNQTDILGNPIANLFYVRGMGGKKRFTLTPNSLMRLPMLSLGQNTLALQDIEFTGLEYVTNAVSANGALIGAVGLAGGAAVNIEFSTSMAFAIMGLENVFRILESNLTLNGQLDFVGLGEDVVHFDFVLRSPVASLNASTQLRDGKVPVLNFATNFIYLTSFSGVARLIFDDATARINNLANAFVATNNGFLGANRLLVSGDPIWDASNDAAKNRFAVEAQEIVAVKKVGDDYERLLPEFGIPIIVDPTHPHRSYELKDLQDFYNEVEFRPQNALQIKKAEQEGIDPSCLLVSR